MIEFEVRVMSIFDTILAPWAAVLSRKGEGQLCESFRPDLEQNPKRWALKTKWQPWGGK